MKLLRGHQSKRNQGLLPVACLAATPVLFAAFAHGPQEKFDTAAYYSANCVECHGKAAEKKFTPDLPESQLIDAILNGQQMEKPPDMPAFAGKGINDERAHALLSYMRSLRE